MRISWKQYLVALSPRLLVMAGSIAAGLTLEDCGGSNSGSGGTCPAATVNECDSPGAACPSHAGYAKFCALTDDGCALECLNVCNNPASFPGGSQQLGDMCEFDGDCGSGLTCDNDVVGGAATCECSMPPTCTTDLEIACFGGGLGACGAADFTHDFGCTKGEWQLKRTCKNIDGTCAEADDDIFIGHADGDSTSVCWVADDEQYYDGEMCGSDFSFSRTASDGSVETGVFHFSTEEEFEGNWIIYDSHDKIVARCKGLGSTTGEPADPPDCTEYDPFGQHTGGITFDGIFQERFNCVSRGACVDQDEASDIIITLGSSPNSYTISSSDGYYNGTATRSGNQLIWTAFSHDPAHPDEDYTEHGTFEFTDSDNFRETTSYKIVDTGLTGDCTGYARRNATPPAPDPLPPCP